MENPFSSFKFILLVCLTFLCKYGNTNTPTPTNDSGCSYQNALTSCQVKSILTRPYMAEDCTNGIDDDGDGYIDCADSDCASSDCCKSLKKQIRKPDSGACCKQIIASATDNQLRYNPNRNDNMPNSVIGTGPYGGQGFLFDGWLPNATLNYTTGGIKFMSLPDPTTTNDATSVANDDIGRPQTGCGDTRSFTDYTGTWWIRATGNEEIYSVKISGQTIIIQEPIIFSGTPTNGSIVNMTPITAALNNSPILKSLDVNASAVSYITESTNECPGVIPECATQCEQYIFTQSILRFCSDIGQIEEIEIRNQPDSTGTYDDQVAILDVLRAPYYDDPVQNCLDSVKNCFKLDTFFVDWDPVNSFSWYSDNGASVTILPGDTMVTVNWGNSSVLNAEDSICAVISNTCIVDTVCRKVFITECPPEICDNGIDDDEDGFPDCADPDCILSACCVSVVKEIAKLGEGVCCEQKISGATDNQLIHNPNRNDSMPNSVIGPGPYGYPGLFFNGWLPNTTLNYTTGGIAFLTLPDPTTTSNPTGFANDDIGRAQTGCGDPANYSDYSGVWWIRATGNEEIYSVTISGQTILVKEPILYNGVPGNGTVVTMNSIVDAMNASSVLQDLNITSRAVQGSTESAFECPGVVPECAVQCEQYIFAQSILSWCADVGILEYIEIRNQPDSVGTYDEQVAILDIKRATYYDPPVQECVDTVSLCTPMDTFSVESDPVNMISWYSNHGATVTTLPGDTVVVVDWTTSSVRNGLDSICVIVSNDCVTDTFCRKAFLKFCYDCETATEEGWDICALLDTMPNNPLATLDCDNGGIDNQTECDTSNDPDVASDDCDAAIAGGVDICAILTADPDNPLATQDCDLGGVDNQTECDNGFDPSEPSDDCSVFATGEEMCDYIGSIPDHPLATKDCDNGGIDNITECDNGGDPLSPVDDCDAAIVAGTDICAILTADPNNPLSTLDCDNGGIDNQTECDNGGDPSDPADECMTAILPGVDVCTILTTDPTNPLATLDCDEGGIDNQTECNNSNNPDDPTDDCEAAISGGVDICFVIGADPNHPLANQDCDNGGIDNYTECTNGQDPSDPQDDCEAAIDNESDICTILTTDPDNPLATLDCDNGGIDNQTECDNGGDPSDPADECMTAILPGVDVCAILTADPNHPLATLDCDNGGIDNQTECNNNSDPDDPADDCDAAINGGVDICLVIGADPNHPLANQDCDNGGIDNYTECVNGGDPNAPLDDCEVGSDTGMDICAILTNDPTHPWSTLDCDNGGVDNQTECDNGGDPNDPLDDIPCPPIDLCLEAVGGNIDICTVLSSDPGNPLGTIDCDGDGVTNEDECSDSTDPLDPCDFDETSITGPVTADQSGCLNLCPDLTPVTTILPGNIAGASPVGVAVEIVELNAIDTDGSPILVRMPSDPRLVFVWNIGLTNVALVPVQNADWNYLGDNGFVHQFAYNGPAGVITGGNKSAFGFEAVYDPQSTDGQTTITASIIPFSGGECNLLNNTDSERLVYFE